MVIRLNRVQQWTSLMTSWNRRKNKRFYAITRNYTSRVFVLNARCVNTHKKYFTNHWITLLIIIVLAASLTNPIKRSPGYLSAIAVQYICILYIANIGQEYRRWTIEKIDGCSNRFNGRSEIAKHRRRPIHEGDQWHLLENSGQIKLRPYKLCTDSFAKGNMFRCQFAKIHRSTYEMHMAQCQSNARKIQWIGLRFGAIWGARFYGHIAGCLVATATRRHPISNG